MLIVRWNSLKHTHFKCTLEEFKQRIVLGNYASEYCWALCSLSILTLSFSSKLFFCFDLLYLSLLFVASICFVPVYTVQFLPFRSAFGIFLLSCYVNRSVSLFFSFWRPLSVSLSLILLFLSLDILTHHVCCCNFDLFLFVPRRFWVRQNRKRKDRFVILVMAMRRIYIKRRCIKMHRLEWDRYRRPKMLEQQLIWAMSKYKRHTKDMHKRK